ncbi:MAG: hypothetical protein OEM52_10680 [bacterium]|nr:hypothetical protein [bacterium]
MPQVHFDSRVVPLLCLLVALIATMLLPTGSAYAQGATVPLSSPAYLLLERAENLGLLEVPLPTHRPLTRVEVARYLALLDKIYGELTIADAERLLDLEREFAFELKKQPPAYLESRSAKLRKGIFTWFPEKLYWKGESAFSSENPGLAIKANPRIRYDWGFSHDNEWDRLHRYGLGWSVQMTWQEKLGVSFRYLDHMDKVPTDGIHTYRDWKEHGTSDHLTAGEQPSFITRNLNEKTYRHESDEYIVSTTSMSYSFGRLNVLLGREPVGWGPGIRHKLTLGSQVSPVDQLRLDFAITDHLRFVYIHGWLRSEPALKDTIPDPGDSQLRLLDRPKYVAAHRLEWTPRHWLTVGLAEAVIYGDRAPELPYLIPVNLFYATEHNRGDNDNKSVAIDLTVRPYKHISAYGGVWIDDLTVGKLGTDYLQNKFGYLGGTVIDDPFGIENLRWLAEYARMDPYAGSHFYGINRYNHWGTPLGLDLPPNADQLAIRTEWQPGMRWHLSAESAMFRHVETATLNGVELAPGDIGSMYPKSVAKLSIPWGEGQGEHANSVEVALRYELIEHCWLGLSWRQVQSGAFNTQPEQRNAYRADALQRRPGLFDVAKKNYSETATLWSLSFQFNPDR